MYTYLDPRFYNDLELNETIWTLNTISTSMRGDDDNKLRHVFDKNDSIIYFNTSLADYINFAIPVSCDYTSLAMFRAEDNRMLSPRYKLRPHST